MADELDKGGIEGVDLALPAVELSEKVIFPPELRDVRAARTGAAEKVH